MNFFFCTANKKAESSRLSEKYFRVARKTQ